MRKISAIVIHCSASANGDARVTRDVIDGWHRARGWNGIGYHYVIHVDGALHDGRPVERIGAHVEGNNAATIGVCLVGTDRFSEPQWQTLRTLVRALELRFPGAAVCGHRDYSPDRDGDGLIEPWEWLKVCPGFDVRAWRQAGMDALWNPTHLLQAAV